MNEPTKTKTLTIGGIVPFTATDYPGHLSAVVFCQGCPWRCAYCHNPHLIPAKVDPASEPYSWSSFYSWLVTRRGLLDGVVFSGGEPTAQSALFDAVADVRALGFKVGLHTGGAYPRRVAQLLPHLDWVGLDIKATCEGYGTVTGVDKSGTPAFETLDRVIASGVSYEVRTTIHGALTTQTQLILLAQELKNAGATRWVLQPFRAEGCDNADLLGNPSSPLALNDALLSELRNVIPDTTVRA
ncbi:MAG: anaerobic ribonucleoside-triphosphate reductase activating protein [Burkholderiales bacterium]|jgi:pyruvate formate lyase activating enzyme|nr:anaerobic ribonucleoside-triphosphate reductase activating protein [Burkholderiales bacterium]